MTHRDLVRQVRRRIDELRLTPYQLHQKLGVAVSKQTVYNFVRQGKIVKSDTLVAILNALGLHISKHRKTLSS